MSLFCCRKTLRLRSYKTFLEVATPFLNARNIGSPFSPRAPTTGYNVRYNRTSHVSHLEDPSKSFLKASSCRTLCDGRPGSQGGPKKKSFPRLSGGGRWVWAVSQSVYTSHFWLLPPPSFFSFRTVQKRPIRLLC